MKNKLVALPVAACLAALCMSAHADGVDFEDQTGPAVFGSGEQTLVYNFSGYSATFSGGTILTGETNQSTDNSSVYATASFAGGLSNPLVITFTAPIHNFQVDVLNAFSGNYELSDNVGDSVLFNLASSGGSVQTVGFAAAGTAVTITYLDALSTGQYDFAIDNVTFNQALCVPEPDTAALMLAGLCVAGIVARRRRQA